VTAPEGVRAAQGFLLAADHRRRLVAGVPLHSVGAPRQSRNWSLLLCGIFQVLTAIHRSLYFVTVARLVQTLGTPSARVRTLAHRIPPHHLAALPTPLRQQSAQSEDTH